MGSEMHCDVAICDVVAPVKEDVAGDGTLGKGLECDAVYLSVLCL